MKNKALLALLGAEAAACVIFCIIGSSFGNAFTSVMAFPFEQLGMWLRTLSLSGGGGNTVAIVVYCGICLAPSVFYAVRWMRRKAKPEDGLLALATVLLFAVLYMMTNPADIARHFGGAEIAVMAGALMGVTVYTVVIGYLILRALRAIEKSTTESLLGLVGVLLGAVSALLVFAIFGSGIWQLIGAFGQLRETNTDGGLLTLSYAFLVFQYLVDVLPYALDILIVFSCLRLADALKEDPYGADVPLSARRAGQVCRLSVIVIILSQIAVNTLQFAAGSLVRSSHYTLSLPLLPVVFALAAMLLSRYFEDARRIKGDNDMFI